MCMSYPTPVPAPPPPPPPPAQTPVPQLPDQGAATVGQQSRAGAMAAAAANAGGTILTGPEGLTTPASSSQKSLLGS